MRDLRTLLMDGTEFATEPKKLNLKTTAYQDYKVITDTEKKDYYGFELKKNPYFDAKLAETVTERLSKSLKFFLRKYKITKAKCVMAVGVGNENITADALGAMTLSHLEVTEHFHRAGYLPEDSGRLSALQSNVSGVTGIASFDIVASVASRTKPDAIIAIDTFCTDRVARLGRVIEVSDRGMTPGGGVGNPKAELSRDTLGIPVIAVGVPLVIYARHIVAGVIAGGERATGCRPYDKKADADAGNVGATPCRPHDVDIAMLKEISSMIVTGKDIDLSVECFAKIIGHAINRAVHS